MTSWYPGKPKVIETNVRVVQVNCECPTEGCKGNLVADGSYWPVNPAGYHHDCNVCGSSWAISGETYPRYEYVPIEE